MNERKIVRYWCRTLYPGEYGFRRQRLGAPGYFFEQARIVPSDDQSQRAMADRAFEGSEFVAFDVSFNRRELSLDVADGT
jgi:hypothetical protein